MEQEPVVPSVDDYSQADTRTAAELWLLVVDTQAEPFAKQDFFAPVFLHRADTLAGKLYVEAVGIAPDGRREAPDESPFFHG